MVLEIEQKPINVYVLIVLWIIVGILFLGMLIVYTLNHLDQLDSTGSSPYRDPQWDAAMNFNFILYFLLFLFLAVFTFLLAYGTFIKKSWSWLIGIMISSFSGFFIYLGIQQIGYVIIMDYFDQMFATAYTSFQLITYILLIIFVPCLIFILTRPNVKSYFEKSQPSS